MKDVIEIGKIATIRDEARKYLELKKWVATIEFFLFGDGAAAAGQLAMPLLGHALLDTGEAVVVPLFSSVTTSMGHPPGVGSDRTVTGSNRFIAPMTSAYALFAFIM